MAKIIVQTPDGTPNAYELGHGVVTVGREEGNDIVIPDSSISRRHAEISFKDGAYQFRDLNSANGSLVNYDLIVEASLKNGDLIHFGTVESMFVEETPKDTPLLTWRLWRPSSRKQV